jgi:2-(1,2-epoxy-1,2-dihydrophenyl)acetyl-CoA isomerase
MNEVPGQSGTVHSEIADGVAVIELDNPARRNAIDLSLREALFEAVSAAMQDDAVRVLILTGKDGVFSSGGDISSMAGVTGVGARQRLARIHRVVRLLVSGEKPVIAAVEGYAIGAGLSLAAACDIVVTARDAKWACSFNRVGLMPDAGALWTLPLRIGLGRARMVMMMADTFDGQAAVEMGLAEIVCEPGEALDRAHAVADKLRVAGPLALGMTKAMLARMPQSLDEALKAEADAQAILFTSEDSEEGRAAFLEKRKPAFKGR